MALTNFYGVKLSRLALVLGAGINRTDQQSARTYEGFDAADLEPKWLEHIRRPLVGHQAAKSMFLINRSSYLYIIITLSSYPYVILASLHHFLLTFFHQSVMVDGC
jgi:hypothetical protein